MSAFVRAIGMVCKKLRETKKHYNKCLHIPVGAPPNPQPLVLLFRHVGFYQ